MSQGRNLEPSESEDAATARPRKRRDSLAASRRRGRSLALQALYEADTSGHDAEAAVQRLAAEATASEEAAALAHALAVNVEQTKAELDDHIRRAAPQWPVEQIAVVDRNILRIAIYEMLLSDETPVPVAVNEAVELAKAFGSDTSPRFVNGVLGALSGGKGVRG